MVNSGTGLCWVLTSEHTRADTMMQHRMMVVAGRSDPFYR